MGLKTTTQSQSVSLFISPPVQQLALCFIFVRSVCACVHTPGIVCPIFGCLPLSLLPLMLQCSTVVGNLLAHLFFSHAQTISTFLSIFCHNTVSVSWCRLLISSFLSLCSLQMVTFSALTFLKQMSSLCQPSSIYSIQNAAVTKDSYTFIFLVIETFLDFQILLSFPLLVRLNLLSFSRRSYLHSPSSLYARGAWERLVIAMLGRMQP